MVWMYRSTSGMCWPCVEKSNGTPVFSSSRGQNSGSAYMTDMHICCLRYSERTWLTALTTVDICQLGIDSMVPNQRVWDVVTRKAMQLTYMMSIDRMMDVQCCIIILGAGLHVGSISFPRAHTVFPLSKPRFVLYMQSATWISACCTRQLGNRLWSTMCWYNWVDGNMMKFCVWQASLAMVCTWQEYCRALSTAMLIKAQCNLGVQWWACNPSPVGEKW